jgi:hypothetical protein
VPDYIKMEPSGTKLQATTGGRFLWYSNETLTNKESSADF